MMPWHEQDHDDDQQHPPPSIPPTEEEYYRLKLELAQTRAKTDTARLQARQLITKRDEIRESVATARANAEEQQLILAETVESIIKLKSQLNVVEEERKRLWGEFEKKGGDESIA